MNETTNETTTETTNGLPELPVKMAHELAIVYEAAGEAAPEIANTIVFEATTEAASTMNAPAEVGDAAVTSAPLVDPTPTPAVSLSSGSSGLRLRMKIWTDRTTGKRYLMPTAFMRDVVNGQPVTDVMYAYAMSDEDTKIVTLTAGEWNTLPFFYFQEDGSAPRATSRPADKVISTGSP